MSIISWWRFDEEVLGGWIRGEDVEAFSKDPFELVEAQIISSVVYCFFILIKICLKCL